MDDNKQYLVPSIVIGLAIVILAGALTLAGKPQVTVSVAPTGAPINISSPSTPSSAPITPNETKFGSSADVTTNWTAGAFSADLTVGGIFTNSGTSTISGAVSSTAVTGEAYGAYASVASSQSLCTIRNTGSNDRVLMNVTLGFATTSITGTTAQNFTISLSSTQGATGTGSDLFVNNGANYTLPSDGTMTFITTSTLAGTGGATRVWRKGDWLNFLIGSPTTTLKGDCRASYMN